MVTEKLFLLERSAENLGREIGVLYYPLLFSFFLTPVLIFRTRSFLFPFFSFPLGPWQKNPFRIVSRASDIQPLLKIPPSFFFFPFSSAEGRLRRDPLFLTVRAEEETILWKKSESCLCFSSFLLQRSADGGQHSFSLSFLPFPSRDLGSRYRAEPLVTFIYG